MKTIKVTFLTIITIIFMTGCVQNDTKNTQTTNTQNTTSKVCNVGSEVFKNFTVFSEVKEKMFLTAKRALRKESVDFKSVTDDKHIVAFVTTCGSFAIKLYGTKAPKTASNFYSLAKMGFYGDMVFHRIIAGFMIQGGDPEGTGYGGPNYTFEDEVNATLKNTPGVVSMANAGANTNGSQFFINVNNNTRLNGGYSVFGEVIEGYEDVVKISKLKTDRSDKPSEEVRVVKIYLGTLA